MSLSRDESVRLSWARPRRARATSALSVALLMLGCLSGAPAFSAASEIDQSATTADTKDWEFIIAPYFWAAEVEGTVVNGGIGTGVDLTLSDLLESTRGALMLYFEARWKRGNWPTSRSSTGI